MKIYWSAIIIGSIIGGYFFAPSLRDRFDNTVKAETAPLAERIEALEEANADKKDEVLEEVAACKKRAIEQTGVDTGYYKLCLDLVLDKREATNRRKNHHFYPASGE